MSTDRAAAAPAPGSVAPGAFGLAIASEASLPGLDRPGAVAGARRVAHRLVEPAALRARLGERTATRVLRQGQGAFRVECHEHAERRLLLRTESFGDHLIADGGRTILSSVGRARPDLWQRFVLGQVLPVTASVQGLEVFHASAVAVAGGALALAGPSQAGKSSIALRLIARGEASFFADDVLALDANALDLVAYPGPGLIGVPADQLAAAEDALPGQIWSADASKALFAIAGERGGLPVRAFVRLTPDEGAAGISFESCLPNRLMATTFDGVTRAPERLLRLLRVAAMLAADGRAQELRYPPGSEPDAVVDALLAQLSLAGAARETS
ncbi:MAG TPA: hypothetical protein VMT37_12385 [Solirubrobacterales bacterium]|nr:hypothetical protein [Solirubrobacterales bacterium]